MESKKTEVKTETKKPAVKTAAVKAETPKAQPKKAETVKTEVKKPVAAKTEVKKVEAVKTDMKKPVAVKPEVKPQPKKSEPAKSGNSKDLNAIEDIKIDNEVKSVKAELSKKEKFQGKQLKVTYIRSAIGYNERQRKILEALGLRKLNQTNILPDNESIRGSIFHVKHLVKVEEVQI